jgi:predicted site-specific integrase-resolvase
LQDIGSGLNFERPSFKRLLDRVYEGSVMEVVVTNKDRLARFGFELIQWLFKKTDTKLLVLHNQEDRQDSRTEEQELAEDLLSIVTVFVAKHNGRRGAENRRKRKALAQERRDDDEREESTEEEKISTTSEDEEESQQTTRRKNKKDPPISKQKRKRKA